jgi:hypothetical protein
MKKLIVLLFLVAFSLSAMAQRSGTTTAIGEGTTKVLSMIAADTITQHATAYWTFLVNKPYASYFAVSVAVDTIGTYSTRTVWDVLGSMDNVNFVATTATQVRLGTTAGGIAVDTTFVLYDVATGTLWKYLKVRAVASASLHIKGAKVSGLAIKVVNK